MLCISTFGISTFLRHSTTVLQIVIHDCPISSETAPQLSIVKQCQRGTAWRHRLLDVANCTLELEAVRLSFSESGVPKPLLEPARQSQGSLRKRMLSQGDRRNVADTHGFPRFSRVKRTVQKWVSLLVWGAVMLKTAPTNPHLSSPSLAHRVDCVFRCCAVRRTLARHD